MYVVHVNAGIYIPFECYHEVIFMSTSTVSLYTIPAAPNIWMHLHVVHMQLL